MSEIREVAEHRALHRFTLADDTCLEVPTCICQPYMRSARSVAVRMVRVEESQLSPSRADAYLTETSADLVYYGQVVETEPTLVVSADGLLLLLPRTQQAAAYTPLANADVRIDVSFS